MASVPGPVGRYPKTGMALRSNRAYRTVTPVVLERRAPAADQLTRIRL